MPEVCRRMSYRSDPRSELSSPETEAEKNQQTTIKPTNSCATPGQTATDPVGKAPVSASPQVESIEAQKTPETDSKN